MRSRLWLAIVAAIVLFALPSSLLAQTPTPVLIAIPTPVAKSATILKAANLRAGPGTTFAIVGSAKLGDKLNIVGTNQAGDWYQADTGTWIAAFLVDLPSKGTDISTTLPAQTPQEPAPTSTTTTPPATVTPQPTQEAAGSSTVQIGQELQGKGWRFKVKEIHKRKAVYFYSNSYVAMGYFLVVIVDAVNEQGGTDYFSRQIVPYLTDDTGNAYRQSTKGTAYATWQYEGIATTYTDVNPGNFVRMALVYDLPSDTGHVMLSTDLPAWVELGNFNGMKAEDK